jgi:hypothetical protein
MSLHAQANSRHLETKRPLEGLEHVLSILHGDLERQLPRNYAGFLDHDDIPQRPKTASCELDAAKMRPKIPPCDQCLSGTREILLQDAGASEFEASDFEHSALLMT